MLALQQEGWQEAQNISLHHVEEQTLCQRRLRNRPSGRAQLEAEQQAASTSLKADAAAGRQLPELGEQVVSCVRHASEQGFVLDDIEELKAQAAGERASAQCTAVFGHAERIKEALIHQQSAQRDPAAQRLTKDQHVGSHAGTCEGKPVSGASQA